MDYWLWEGLIHFLAWEDWDVQRFVAYLKGLLGSYPRENLFSCYNLTGSHDKPRLMTLCRGDARRVALIVALIVALPGVPAMYYGDEVGLLGGEDPDCRRCFPWDPSRWDTGLCRLFRELIRIRREEVALRRGEVRLGEMAGRGFSLVREHGPERVILFLNAGDGKACFALSHPARDL